QRFSTSQDWNWSGCSSIQAMMDKQGLLAGLLVSGRLLEPEPVEGVRTKGQEVRQLPDVREPDLADEFHWLPAAELREVEFGILHEAAEIHHAEQYLPIPLPQVHEHLHVLWMEEPDRVTSKRLVALSNRDHPFHPVEQGCGSARLGFDI